MGEYKGNQRREHRLNILSVGLTENSDLGLDDVGS